MSPALSPAAASPGSAAASSSAAAVMIPQRKSRLRRQPKKPVPTHLPKNQVIIWGTAICCLASLSILPIILLESSLLSPESVIRSSNDDAISAQVMQATKSRSSAASVHHLMDMARQIRQHPLEFLLRKNKKNTQPVVSSSLQQQQQQNHAQQANVNHVKRNQPQPEPPALTLDDLKAAVMMMTTTTGHHGGDDSGWYQQKKDNVARGVAGLGLSLDQTPAVVGARRADIKNCPINVDSLAYWNDPVGTRDQTFVTPFASSSSASSTNKRDKSRRKYITFAPDRGGWNNVRMSMEIIFVLAAATGRTLVLPPKEPLYLLNKDKGEKHKGFVDFFPIEKMPLETMSMEDFLATEEGKLLPPIPAENRTLILNAAGHCDKQKKSDSSCFIIMDYLLTIGKNMDWSAVDTCLVFDEQAFNSPTTTPSDEAKALAEQVCGTERQVTYWDAKTSEVDILHFRTNDNNFRLLTHFYAIIHFSNPQHDHYYKRFVRDYLHYNDIIYCAAGKIVKALQQEGMQRGFVVDDEGAGAYSAMHIRRGDLQYKKVKIPAAEWYNNTKELWQPNEILYIATDERNKTFFDDLAAHYDLRFLDQYTELASLKDLDPNYMGMVDTIVASRGRVFAGTWFSTFTGYINRLRGYHGMSMHDSWYSFLPKKTAVHEWKVVTGSVYAFEWPDGWVGIDADTWPEKDVF